MGIRGKKFWLIFLPLLTIIAMFPTVYTAFLKKEPIAPFRAASAAAHEKELRWLLTIGPRP